MMKDGYSVWLYGSHARGDKDSQSDVDVFVAGTRNLGLDEIEDSLPVPLNAASLSQYSWDEIYGMAEYGSLFLHHLRLEGRPIYESPSCKGRLGHILQDLRDYQWFERDLNGFWTVLRDVADALRDGTTEVFELSVLGTVIRHCSILGCWVLGEPSFGRTKPVNHIVRALGLPICIGQEFRDLYQYRLYVEGRISDRYLLKELQPHTWLHRSEALVATVEDLVRE